MALDLRGGGGQLSVTVFNVDAGGWAGDVDGWGSQASLAVAVLNADGRDTLGALNLQWPWGSGALACMLLTYDVTYPPTYYTTIIKTAVSRQRLPLGKGGSLGRG